MPSAQEVTVMPHAAVPRLGAIKAKKGVPDLLPATTGQKLGIIDIRHAAVEINLKSEVLSLFCNRDGPRKLPTLLLYDERGLQLFEKVRHS
jgi:L-histidine Nalpha-methyltransferase / hercynylcysteine S-oxide synthase